MFGRFFPSRNNTREITELRIESTKHLFIALQWLFNTLYSSWQEGFEQQSANKKGIFQMMIKTLF